MVRMPRQWWGSLLLLVCLVLGVTPVQAAVGRVGSLYPWRVLEPAALDRLAALQQISSPLILSPISPDDGAALALVGGRLGFLDVHTGAIQPVATSMPLALLAARTGSGWRDASTLVSVVDGLVVSFDRSSGRTSTRRYQPAAYPLSLAPTGRHLLVGAEDWTPDDGLSELPRTPFDQQVRLTFQTPAGREPVAAGLGPSDDDVLRAASTSIKLAVQDVDSGRVLLTYGLGPGSLLRSVAWSADGARLAVVRQSLRAPDAPVEPISPLKEVATQDALGRLPPERNPLLQTSVVDLLDLGTGAVQTAALRAVPGDGDIFVDAAWSPDNSTLMTMMLSPSQLAGRPYPSYVLPERARYRFYGADGTLHDTLSHPALESPATIGSFISPDEVLFNNQEQANVGLAVYTISTNSLRRLPLAPGVAGGQYGVVIAPGSRQVLFTHSSFTQVPEIFRINLDGSALVALTHANAGWESANQVRVDEVQFTLASGQQRSGYLIQPASATFPPADEPLIVWQEGGPYVPMLNRFGNQVERPFNLLPNFGLPVLFVPLVGRYGYGVERYRALYEAGSFGQRDIDEQAEIVEQMIARGWTSRGRVGITGCSYGGYFTAQSIARYPGLYAAANPQASLLELLSEFTDRNAVGVAYITGVAPPEQPEVAIAASPLYASTQVRAATLLFHGSGDFLPVGLAMLYHDAIQAGGAPVNLLVFSGEWHGLTSPASQLTAGQWQILWFRQYLAPAASP